LTEEDRDELGGARGAGAEVIDVDVGLGGVELVRLSIDHLDRRRPGRMAQIKAILRDLT
jgi:hypothetical protein